MACDVDADRAGDCPAVVCRSSKCVGPGSAVGRVRHSGALSRGRSRRPQPSHLALSPLECQSNPRRSPCQPKSALRVSGRRSAGRSVVRGDEGIAEGIERRCRGRRDARRPSGGQRHERRLVARARGAAGGQERGVGLDQQPVARDEPATSADASSPARNTSPEKLIARPRSRTSRGVVDGPENEWITAGGRSPNAAAARGRRTRQRELADEGVLGVAAAGRSTGQCRIAGLPVAGRGRGCAAGSPAGRRSGENTRSESSPVSPIATTRGSGASATIRPSRRRRPSPRRAGGSRPPRRATGSDPRGRGRSR